VRVYHPDTQGPMDICELLWGSSLFLALLDTPELVKALLDLITQTYIRFMQTWTAIAPLAADYNVHWSLLHRGKIMLRDDSAMNLSPAMFAEFVEPYDQRLLDAFGGGAIHFCGKGSHYIHRIPAMRGVYAINMSQPDYNDMETIFRHTADRGIKILGLARDTAEEALRQGRNLHGNVHCW
jgi:uroporphyrinogen-III decarboxylase